MKKILFIAGIFFCVVANAQIDSISNGESGSSVRATLNSVIDAVNDMSADSLLVSSTDTLTLKGDRLLGDSINAVFKSISTSDFISSADSFNFKSLGVRFDKQITNLDYLSGNAQSYIALFDEYLTLYYGNQTSASDILIDTNVIEIEPGLFGSYTDKFTYHFYNDKLYIINVTDTIFTFDTDTLLSDSIHGSFKSLSTKDTLHIDDNGHIIFELPDGDLAVKSKDGNGVFLGDDDIGGAYVYSTSKVTIDGDVDIDIVSNLNTYSVVNDTLFGEQENAKFKNFFAELGGFFGGFFSGDKATLDTLILDGDTATTMLYLDEAVEAETFSEFNFDTATKAYSEGRMFYQEETRSIVFYNDISSFAHNVGYELVARVYNNSGATINNGNVVRLTGNFKENGNITPAIKLAGNSSSDSTLILGMATVNIANGSYGIVTLRGEVKALNTSAISSDSAYIYLGFSGTYVDTVPEPPYLSVPLGQVYHADADSGRIFFNPSLPTYDPAPHLSSDSSNFSTAVSIITQNVYEYIPISKTVVVDNYGFTVQGDSVQVNVGGEYTIVLSMSFQGNPSSETWRYGVFIDNVEQHTKSRVTSSSQTGDVNVPISRNISKDSWISFRIRNESGVGDPTIIDLSYELIFLHE